MAGWKVKRQVAVDRFANLEYATFEGLGFVAGVIEGLVQFRMHVGNVKAFEVVVHVEHPVGFNGMVSVP